MEPRESLDMQFVDERLAPRHRGWAVPIPIEFASPDPAMRRPAGWQHELAREGIQQQPPAVEAMPVLREVNVRQRVALPLRLVGLATEDSHLAVGLADEITTALSRFRWLFVLANASAVQIGGGVAGIVDRLGIRYLVEGSFADEAELLVLRCRLVEASSKRQIWQERLICS